MDPRLQLRVQRYGWDAAASLYEDGWRGPLAPAQQTLLRLAALRPGQGVIEAASGSGLVTLALAKAVGPAGRVLATDLAQNMVALTSAACAAAGYGWVSTERLSADDLRVEPSSFDAAVCALGLMYVPDPGRAVASMAAATRPGGRVVATVWGERRLCGWAEIFPIVDARVVSEVCPLFFASGAPGSLRRDFEQAGLSIVEEHRQREVLVFADRTALLSAMLLGGPVALAAKRFSPQTMAEVEEEFLASVAQFVREDGGYAVPGEFVTVAGVRR